MPHVPFTSVPITTALTGNTALAGEIVTGHISDAVFTAKFTYGSGGTTAKAWVQTMLDGVNWVDIASFAFTTASATKVSAVKAATVVAAAYTPTDGSLADDTIKDGLLGHRFRVKVTTTGTYAGSTSLLVTCYSRPTIDTP